MSKPFALCLEDLCANDADNRYLCCVAIAGRAPGLRLSQRGEVLWRTEQSVAAELWISGDERLVLFRTDASTRTVLHRDRRSLELPVGKPVIVIDEDEIEIGDARWRVHVHGPTSQVTPPEPLARRRGWPLAGLAAAVAVSTLVSACPRESIEVRPAPPSMMPTPAPTPPMPSDSEGGTPSADAPTMPPTSETAAKGASAEHSAKAQSAPDANRQGAPSTKVPAPKPKERPGTKPPIEIRNNPPDIQLVE